MNKVERTIMSIGGHPHRSCYRDLCWAIHVEMSHFPEPLQMKFIVAEVCEWMFSVLTATTGDGIGPSPRSLSLLLHWR